MPYNMVQNLQLIYFYIYYVIESFMNVFMYHLAMDSIVVYRITIIPNTLNKVVDYMELKIIKDWLI